MDEERVQLSITYVDGTSEQYGLMKRAAAETIMSRIAGGDEFVLFEDKDAKGWAMFQSKEIRNIILVPERIYDPENLAKEAMGLK